MKEHSFIRTLKKDIAHEPTPTLNGYVPQMVHLKEALWSLVAYSSNPSTWDTEAGGSLWVECKLQAKQGCIPCLSAPLKKKKHYDNVPALLQQEVTTLDF